MEDEITTLARIRRIGGSLVATIPAIVAKANNILEDDIIKLNITKQKKDYFGALRGIGSFKEEDEFKGQLEE